MTNLAETVAKGQYTSFGGADISAVIGNQIVGTLQAISYSVTREKAPVYTMRNSPDPIAFARGKRAVAGTLVLLTINEQSFMKHMKDIGKNHFYGSQADMKFENTATVDAQDFFNQAAGADEDLSPNFQSLNAQKVDLPAWYADQILPFDVNIAAANEYGNLAKMSVIGVEILNQGGGISIDDLVLEEQYTYIAKGVTPLIDLSGTRAK